MDYKYENVTSETQELVPIQDDDIYQTKNRTATANDEAFVEFENFNQFFYYIQDLIQQLMNAVDFNTAQTSEDEINERLSASCDIIEKMINTETDKNAENYYQMPEFNSFFEESNFLNYALSILNISEHNDFSATLETLKSNFLSLILQFLSEASHMSVNITIDLFNGNFLPIFTNPANIDLFSEEQKIFGILIMNNIFQKCLPEILYQSITDGYIDFLLSNIENRESTPHGFEKFDNAIVTTLATFLMRAMQLDIPGVYNICLRLFSNIQTLNIDARGKLIYLIFNLLVVINPNTNRPVLTTKDFSKIILPDNSRLIFNVFLYIGNIDLEVSKTALKIAIFFFNKEVFSPKIYYVYALQLPWSNISNKIISNDDAAPFAINLIIKLLAIDKRNVDPKYLPDDTFFHMILKTGTIQTIIHHYQDLDFKIRQYCIDLFMFLCVEVQDDLVGELIELGVIHVMFQYLESDDINTIKNILFVLSKYVDKTASLDSVFNKLLALAHEDDLPSILEEMADTEADELAHELYIQLHFDEHE